LIENLLAKGPTGPYIRNKLTAFPHAADIRSTPGLVGEIPHLLRCILVDAGRGYQTAWTSGYYRRSFLYSQGGIGYGTTGSTYCFYILVGTLGFLITAK
jgi:hypothetical protein